jgi:KipI family sensor histidine kinase inhibitor
LSEAPRYPRFLPVGDTALSVEFGDAVASELNEAVVGLDIAVAAAELDGILETVPSYRSLLICYEPLETSFPRLVTEIQQLLADGLPAAGVLGANWTVPVIFDPPFADDLPDIAQRQGLTREAAIGLLTSADMPVYAVGFVPGMPYLGGIPPELHVSRREVPRPQVPVGAILIGGAQGAILPVPVPSGWHIVGRTPLRPFEPDRPDPFLFRTGDHVRFRRVGITEFDHLSSLASEALLPLVRNSR